MHLVNRWLRRGVLRARANGGQSLAEFALVLPVLMLLVLITIDFGRIFLSYIALNNTVRVAANFGSLNPNSFAGTPNTTTYYTVVGAESSAIAGTCPIEGVAGFNPPLPTYPAGTGLGAVSQATMTCDFTFITPFITAFFGGNLPITASAQFPVRTGALANIGGGTTVPPPGSPVAAFSFTGQSAGGIDASGDLTATANTITVNFADASSSAQTWDWVFNNGTPDYSDDNKPPTQTYSLPNGATSPSTWTVTLTVANTQGSSSVSHTITLTPTVPNPIAGFYGTPVGSPPQASGGGSSGTQIEGSKTLTVNFINTSSGTTGYSWNFGDGSAPDTTTAPSHAYTSLGIFDVVLSVTNPTGVAPFTRTGYVTVGCIVPNFANTSTDAAQSTWSAAGFGGAIAYVASGSQGGSTTAPAGKNIVSQAPSSSTPTFNATGGAFDTPWQQNKNKPWQCVGDITLTYTP